MSEAITWRSMAAPDFRSSAAMMSGGNETINQGINSLAALAKGYADEQKGIAVSNAVADISNTTNDADRMSVFNAHAANLKDRGIDQKDLIAANQAQRANLTAEGAARDTHDMSASNILTNTARQAGLAIENDMNRGKFDYQKTEQEQQTAKATMDLAVARSGIDVNASSITSARINDALHQAQAGEIGQARADAKAKEASTEAGMAILYKQLNNPENFIKDANGTPIGVDKKLALDKTLASNVSMSNILNGDAAMDKLTDEAAKAEAAKTTAANKEKRAFAQDEQNIKDVSKNNADAITAIKNNQDTSNHWWTGNFGQDTEKLGGDAVITAAGAIRVKDPSGKEVGISPLAIAAAVKEHSHSGSWVNGGDLDVDAFTKTMKMEASAIHAGVPVEELITKLKKGLTTQQMMNGTR